MTKLTEAEARSRLAGARVAYLATVRADGRPHVVPIVFAVSEDGATLYSIADPKPKRGLDLLRHRNVAANPAVSVLVDEYREPWNGIWWARADGTARVAEDGEERELTIRLLRGKYPDYATWSAPFGAATIVEVSRWSGWALSA